MAEKHSLTKRDVQKTAFFWHMTSHMTYNYQRLQAGCLAWIMGPIFEKLYPNDHDKMVEGLERHMLYFNTEPRWGAVLPGMVVALEEGLANDDSGEMDASIIAEIKTALMGPLAGIGDTVWAGLIKPIILSVTLGWAMQGYVWGAWAYGIVGLFCLGAMIVKYVSIGAVLEIEMKTGTLNLGEIMNKIFPCFLPLVTTLFAYWLQVKGKKITTVLIVLFVIGFIGGAVGLLG